MIQPQRAREAASKWYFIFTSHITWWVFLTHGTPAQTPISAGDDHDYPHFLVSIDDILCSSSLLDLTLSSRDWSTV